MEDILCRKLEQLPRTAFAHVITPISTPCRADVLWISPQGFSAERSRRASDFHVHSFFEVHFGLRGCVIYESAQGDRYTVEKGGYICLPPNIKHRIAEASPDAYRLSVTLSVPDIKSEAILCGSAEWVDSFLTLCLVALEKNDASTPTLLSTAVSAMMLLLPIGTPTPTPIQPHRDVRLLRAIRYMEDNAVQALRVSDVAQAAHVSPRQLERLFLSSEGYTVSHAIDRVRIKAAKDLLCQEDMSVFLVAERLSFSNEYNFIRFFKRMEGVTPGKYRARIQKTE